MENQGHSEEEEEEEAKKATTKASATPILFTHLFSSYYDGERGMLLHTSHAKGGSRTAISELLWSTRRKLCYAAIMSLSILLKRRQLPNIKAR